MSWGWAWVLASLEAGKSCLGSDRLLKLRCLQ